MVLVQVRGGEGRGGCCVGRVVPAGMMALLLLGHLFFWCIGAVLGVSGARGLGGEPGG